MRLPRPFLRSLASLTLAFTLLGGCAYKNALERGDQAMAGQRYEEALKDYEEALKLKPDSEEAKKKVAAARDKAIEVRVASARVKLKNKNLAGAVTDTAAAVALRPDAPAVRSLVDEVVAAVAAEGERLTGAGLHAEAVALFDLTISGLPGERARIEASRKTTVDSWLAALDTGATAATAAGRTGDALLQRAMMVELGDAGRSSERDRLRDALRAALIYRVRQTGSAKDAAYSELAQKLTGADPVRWIEVLATGVAAPEAAATLTFSLQKPKFAVDKSTRSESAQYQSGTKQVPNPFYKSAQDKVADRERAVLEAEKEVTNQEKYVQQYSKDVAAEGDTPNTTTGAEQSLSNAQSRLESARNKVNSERDQLQQARDELGRTQQTTEEPVYSKVDYKITKHTVTASAKLTATITDRKGGKVEIAKDVVEVASDETHDGAAVASVAADPLDLPPRDALEAKLRANAFAELATGIGVAFAAFRQGLFDAAKSAGSDDERADKLVQFMLVDGAASDPSVDEQLFKLRGIPEATARLRRAVAGK